MTLDQIKAIVARITYRNWEFRLEADGNSAFVQVRFWATDNDDPTIVALQSCRKWRISYHMTEDEVLQTCWLAVEQAERHEARENFKVDGVAVFHSHIPIALLKEVAEYRVLRA